MPVPKTYSISEDLDVALGTPFPSVVVVSPGLSTRNFPMMEGDGLYRAFFDISAGVVVEANNRPNTKRLVRMYTAVMRSILLHKQDLRGHAWYDPAMAMGDGTEWLDESWDDYFQFTDTQTISMGQVVFEVEVAGVVSRTGGPASPDVRPNTYWGDIQSATATVKPKED